YFMRLLDSSQYSDPVFSEIGIGTGGSQIVGEVISKKLYRFIKGYEAFSSEAYMDSGNVPTIGYGVTESNPYWNSLFPLCTEEKASKVLAETMFNDYAKPLYKDMQSCGVDLATVKQAHFDAFLDLCYNGGLGAVTSSPMYSKWVVNQNDSRVIEGWETWYIRDNNGTVQEGLKDRRKKEIDIFTNSNYHYKSILNIVNGQYDGYITDNDGHGYIPENLGGEL
ncbi:MAG: lysozyme, partial [Paraclostridium sp.]